MSHDYSDLAYDALGIIRLMQSGENEELADDLNVLVGDRGEIELIDLIVMLAALTATLADEWRASVLRLTPEDLRAHVPSSDQLIQDMIMQLKAQETADV